ncbi:NADPH-dependent diflavin oxidoreductase 1 [Aspergillus oleicola]
MSGRRSVLVLYGSETGNAQDVAEEVGAVAERLHFSTQVSELNHVKPESLKSYTIVVFAVSTTGQGDLPANARTFWRSLLLKKLPPTFLSGVRFTWFGLGDSSYPKFNWAARKLYKRLLQLGAEEIYPGGEADHQHPEGLEGTFIPWLTAFRQDLLDKYPLPSGQEPIPDDVQLPPKWVLQLQDQDTSPIPEIPASPNARGETISQDFPDSYRLDHDVRPLHDSLKATLTQNKRVTPQTHFQDVRHLTLTVSEPVSYSPGDVIAITPKNTAEDVQSLIEMMGWHEQADRLVTLVPRDNANTNTNTTQDDQPTPPIHNLSSHPNLTLRSLLTNYLDIRAIPRRSFFSSVAHYTTYEMHKERLLEFTNPEFLDEFWDYTTRPRRSILEILHEFDTVKIPWQHATSAFPILRGRQFSIASGGELKRTSTGGARFDLLIAIVKYRTVIKKIREGVCTKYISNLRPGSTLHVQLQRGGLNSSVSQLVGPTLLIGPGTGVAPLRSMLWEKAAIVKSYREENPGVDPPIEPSILLYGGRNRSSDFFFEEEWNALAELIKLRVLTAFSRDQKNKVYVQDVVKDHSATVFDLLHDKGGAVFVCGSSGRMPQAVREALTEAFQGGNDEDDLGFTRREAEDYLVGMEKTGRYKQETW